jgi:monoamine oxidase
LLRAAGHSFLLLEAIDRIGGRAWTSDRQFGTPFDMGCALPAYGRPQPLGGASLSGESVAGQVIAQLSPK